jgi:hypothetical protein
VNLQPDIIRPEGADLGEPYPVAFRSDSVVLSVVAQDPERQPLTFLWFVAGGVVADANTYSQAEDVWVSALTVSIDQVADGDEIRCTVLDDNPRSNAVDVAWIVELP